MTPLGLASVEALSPRSGDIILDVGCGAGQTILQLAGRVGAAGRIIAVDVAPRVLEVAKERTANLPNVELLKCDASQLAFADGTFDAVYSRFGVMFFADPVKAFANFARMLKPNGRLGFVCWRSLRQNELDMFPLQAADLPFDDIAGPFSLEDAETIARTLTSAGFRKISTEAYDCAVSCGGVDDTLKVVTRVGALGMMLRTGRAALAQVEAPVRAALASRAIGGSIYLNAATWVVTAMST